MGREEFFRSTLCETFTSCGLMNPENAHHKLLSILFDVLYICLQKEGIFLFQVQVHTFVASLPPDENRGKRKGRLSDKEGGGRSLFSPTACEGGGVRWEEKAKQA